MPRLDEPKGPGSPPDGDGTPTLDGHRGHASGAKTEPLRTMQVPRGAPHDAGAAPLIPTLVPPAGAPAPDTAPPPMPPDWRYELGDEIARGGMGRVVEATDTVLGRSVALKEALSADPEAIRRFQRETRITARLEHPSIVPVHDAGTSPGGAPYYVMRKVSGQPLEDLVGDRTALADRIALLPHIVAAAQAVAHAHARGIVHRDIKPANILVGDLGETILIDWGLAKAIGEPDDLRLTSPIEVDKATLTRAGIVYGTPGFMSPEQLRGAPVDERCDVYALGATLYHLLARRPPHHDKDPEQMMKTAADGPPPPIREVVPGVARALATIIDKALAHDAAARYPDAGALAEDLQRFLTGQLVASHHYSTRERVVRFVRKNRTSVAITVVAVGTLIVGGTFALAGIVKERNRANREAGEARTEKQRAEDKSAQVTDSLARLTLAEARGFADTQPTRAVAMVKSLATSERWRRVRAVGAAARATGVAFSLPASPHTMTLELGRDGQRALAAGNDGVVRLHELGRRTTRTLADVKGPAIARFADNERRVVIARATQVTIVDVATGAHRDLVAPTAIAKLEVSGPIAYWVDVAGAVWTLDVDAIAPKELALDETVRAVMPSPDGRWIALAGSAHLLLVDRTQPTLPPEAIADGATRDLVWAADASRLAALVEQDVVDVDITPSLVAHRLAVGNRYAVGYSGSRVLAAGATGIAIVGRDELHSRKEIGDYRLGLHEVTGGVVVTGGGQGILKVLSDDGDRMLTSPLVPITRIETSPRAGWVIAAAEDRLLAWDLGAILPRHLTRVAPNGAGFVSGDQIIASTFDGPAQWIDLRTDKITSLPAMAGGLAAVVPAPDGQHAVAIDGTHHARLVAPLGEPIELEGDVTAAAFVDDRRLVVGTSTGMLRLEQLVPAHTETLVQRGAAVIATTTTVDGWVAAAFADRTLWRQRLGGSPTKLDVAMPPPRDALALAGDGTVVFAVGSRVLAWRPTGAAAETIAELARPVVSIAIVDHGPDKVLAITADGTASVVSIDGPRVESPQQLAAATSISSAAGLVAALSPDGLLEAVDPVVQERWTLATPKGQPFSYTQISGDGRRVLAVTPQGLLVWTLALPQTADDTARWLDAMTNAMTDAIAEHGPTSLTWR